MAKFRAVTVPEPGVIGVKEYERLEPRPKDVLLRIEMTGVCGTDPHIIFDEKPLPWITAKFYPFIPGHEFIARIEEVGSDFPRVDPDGEPIKVGDLVGVSVEDMDSSPCGRCYNCATGFPVLCSQRVPKDYPILEKGWQRGWAEFRYTHGAEAVYKLPEDLPLEAAVLVEPLSIAVSAFQRAAMGASWLYQGMGPGKTVVIQGSGPIGVLLTVMAKLSGAGKVIVVGAPDNRLSLCAQFGADDTISIERIKDPDERISRVKELTPLGIGADVVFEAAGVKGAFTEGIGMVRDKGTFVELGHFTDRGSELVNPFLLCSKNINLLGVFGGMPTDFLFAKRILARYHEKIPFEKIVTHRFSLDQADEALKAMRNMDSMKTVIIPAS
ncbi:MAG TPA: zinc-binding dehydrogenase [Nitrososphaerales archaeon]|nr:zinc-binding dehydrogenase [Nitrososphaerales archaeon]